MPNENDPFGLGNEVRDYTSGQSSNDDEKTLSGIDSSVASLEATLSGNDAFTQMQQQNLSQSSAAAESARVAASRQSLAQSGLSTGAQTSALRQDQTAIKAQEQQSQAQLGTQLAGRQDRAASSLANIKQAEERIEQTAEKFEYQKGKDAMNVAKDSWNEFLLTFDFETFDTTPNGTAMVELEALWTTANPGAPFPGVQKIINAQKDAKEIADAKVKKETMGVAQESWGAFLDTFDFETFDITEGSAALKEAQELYAKAFPDAPPLTMDKIIADKKAKQTADELKILNSAKIEAQSAWKEALKITDFSTTDEVEKAALEANLKVFWEKAYPDSEFPGIQKMIDEQAAIAEDDNAAKP